MPQHAPCLRRFSQAITDIALPERFTFPFYYQPHALCRLAAQEVQHSLQGQQTWQHNFGLGDDPQQIIGKMFGVLLVQDNRGELGYLAAFSGKLAEQNHIDGFVPPVFDLLADGSFFLQQQITINHLNEEIVDLEKAPQLAELQKQLSTEQVLRDRQIADFRAWMIEQRKARKTKREAASKQYDAKHFATLHAQLDQQSIADKLQLKALTLKWQTTLAKTQAAFNALNDQIIALKEQRKRLSAALQQQIFEQYQFLNSAGKHKSLQAIFSQTALRTPPAGAGECAAPKLLQYAFVHQLTPLAMAEFWWGASPKSEIRQHQQFYPACMGKCQPILAHMLEGIQLDENPLLVNQAEGKNLELVFQDAAIVIVNKPAEFLSVPGKDIQDSVYQRIKNQFPLATGSLIVHRLDMSTSGLMVIALTPQAHKNLQRQFIQRTVKKTYVAVVEGLVEQNSGTISLPLRGNLYDRPRQVVCHEHGKPATTHWQVISRNEAKQQTTIALQPHTGRTHQLRVHCAHFQGLNMPIVGDDLYGQAAKRLHLHAEQLALKHPVSNIELFFQIEAKF